MKTQVFNEQQLKDLVEGKEVVIYEPVKEGDGFDIPKRTFEEELYMERPKIGDYYLFCHGKSKTLGIGKIEKIFGHVCNWWTVYMDIGFCRTNIPKQWLIKKLNHVQASNEKGEKQWYCPECNISLENLNSYSLDLNKPIRCWKCDKDLEP